MLDPKTNAEPLVPMQRSLLTRDALEMKAQVECRVSYGDVKHVYLSSPIPNLQTCWVLIV